MKSAYTLRLLLISIIATAIFTAIGCKKIISVDPGGSLPAGAKVFENDNAVNAAMIGVYHKLMKSSSSFINTQVTVIGGLSADELTDHSNLSDRREFFLNNITPANTGILILWRDVYEYIYQCNAVLEGLVISPGVSGDIARQIEGEAKFVRGFCHFYLVNLFGAVPLITSTDYKVNATASREPENKVYDQIIADLLEAQNMLPDTYPEGERVRPNKGAATAMLARVYIYINDWPNAEKQASTVIASGDIYTLVKDAGNVFLKNSQEAIWQLKPVIEGLNTWEGNTFILTGSPASITLSDQLVSAFEPGDDRRIHWLNSFRSGANNYYYPYKYKIRSGSEVTEYLMVLRLAEQYLIRAEARSWMGNISAAVDDLNIIRSRARLPIRDRSLSLDECLEYIMHERRLEFFAEQAHRWLDLKRTGMCDDLLPALKSGWKTTAQYYPIPGSEILNDPNLKQNPGY